MIEGDVEIRRGCFRSIKNAVLGRDQPLKAKIKQVLTADEFKRLEELAKNSPSPDYRHKEKLTEKWNLIRRLCYTSSKLVCEEAFMDPLIFKVFEGVFETLLEQGPTKSPKKAVQPKRRKMKKPSNFREEMHYLLQRARLIY